MVGGRAEDIQDEKVYRFEFPERPGALLNFLSRMSEEWNISLFHYRNHSDAYGRVLVGVQVPANQTADFEAYLDCLKYPYVSEQDNPAYHLFLSTN
jgi:threonine dehydratase